MDTEVREARAASAGAPDHLPRAIFATCIVAAPVLATWHGLRVAEHLPASATTAPLLLLAIVTGALGADLVSGLVHWACDTWGDERTPWVGAGLIHAFREHHREPRAMLAHDWIEVNGEAAAAACGGFVFFCLPAVQSALASHPFAHATLVSLVLLSAVANQMHQWAHMCAPPRLVRSLQRASLILSPVHHAAHHTAPFDSAYCISTGWLNGLLDRIGFWRALERAINRTTGQPPGSGNATHRRREEE